MVVKYLVKFCPIAAKHANRRVLLACLRFFVYADSSLNSQTALLGLLWRVYYLVFDQTL